MIILTKSRFFFLYLEMVIENPSQACMVTKIFIQWAIKSHEIQLIFRTFWPECKSTQQNSVDLFLPQVWYKNYK